MEFPAFSFELSSMREAVSPDPDVLYDLLILGGGPAAMTAALYAARKMMKLAMLTGEIGGQMSDTSDIENYMGFQTIKGPELVEKFKEHALHFDIPVGQGDKVVEVQKAGDLFETRLQSGTRFRSRTVIVATGKRSRNLNVPGEKELAGKGVAYCAICDAPFYKDKKATVAGGGNSAFTAALDLLKVAKEVTLVNFSQGWQADQILIDAVRKYGRLRLLDHHAVTRIEGTQRVTGVRVQDRASGAEKTLEADGIFVEIGLIPNSEPVRNLAPLNEAGELLVDCNCRTSVEGLFGAGDVTTVPFKQIVIAAGEGAKAALSAYEHLAMRGLL